MGRIYGGMGEKTWEKSAGMQEGRVGGGWEAGGKFLGGVVSF